MLPGYVTKVRERLYLGSYQDVIDTEVIEKLKIDAIVSVGKEKHTPENLYDFPVFRFEIWNELPTEIEENRDEDIIAAVNKVCALYNEGKIVLLHCISSKNRSPLIMTAVLIQLGFNNTIEEGLSEIGIYKKLKSMPRLVDRMKRLYDIHRTVR